MRKIVKRIMYYIVKITHKVSNLRGSVNDFRIAFKIVEIPFEFLVVFGVNHFDSLNIKNYGRAKVGFFYLFTKVEEVIMIIALKLVRMLEAGYELNRFRILRIFIDNNALNDFCRFPITSSFRRNFVQSFNKPYRYQLKFFRGVAKMLSWLFFRSISLQKNNFYFKLTCL